jgi:hypothetical protein
MKKLYSVVLILVTLCVLSCSKSTPEPEVDRVKRLLSTGGTWSLEAATVDGVNQLSLYEGLSISFTDVAFTTTNGGALWPASGTWSFTDATAKVIERNDGLLLTIEEVAEARIVLVFTWSDSTFSEGRLMSIGGTHLFTLTR